MNTIIISIHFAKKKSMIFLTIPKIPFLTRAISLVCAAIVPDVDSALVEVAPLTTNSVEGESELEGGLGGGGIKPAQ